MNTYLKVFLLGVFIAPLGDMAHVATNTTWYPSSYAWYLGGIPWWVFPFFGLSGVFLGFINHTIDTKILRTKKVRAGEINLSLAMTGPFLFLLAYLLTGILKDNPELIHLLLGLLAFTTWWFLDKTYQGLLLALSTAVAGTLVEISLVSLGVFKYLKPDFSLGGVASWLPWIYVILSLGLGNLIRYHKIHSVKKAYLPKKTL